MAWHDADVGLTAIDGLIRAVTDTPDAVDNARLVILDLEKIRSAFERARVEGIRFSFLIEEMEGTSGLVWDRRGGSV